MQHIDNQIFMELNTKSLKPLSYVAGTFRNECFWAARRGSAAVGRPITGDIRPRRVNGQQKEGVLLPVRLPSTFFLA